VERLGAADTRVEFDVKIPEVQSGALRQVDVAVWIPEARGDMLVAIECRDYKSKLNVTHVEQLQAKHDKLATSRLIIVSRLGFSAGANRAALSHARTQLLVLDDLGEADWPDWIELEPLEVRTVRWDFSDPKVFMAPASPLLKKMQFHRGLRSQTSALLK
jgi:hypothetical protein